MGRWRILCFKFKLFLKYRKKIKINFISFKMHTKNRISGNHCKYLMKGTLEKTIFEKSFVEKKLYSFKHSTV